MTRRSRSGPIEYVIVTREFLRGQDAAKDTAAKYGAAAARPHPGVRAAARAGDEFAVGYCYEWRNYIEPTI